MHVTIMDMLPGDVGEVLTVQLAAFLSEGRRYRDLMLPPLVEDAEGIHGFLRTGRGLVARTQSGRLAGSVRWEVKGETAHLGRLAVAPDLQGHGIATALMHAVEDRCGTARIELFTGSRSEESLRFYARLGYVEFGRRLVPRDVTLVELAKQLRVAPG